MKIAICLADSYKEFYKPFSLSLVSVVRYFDAWSFDREMDNTLDILMAQNGNIADMRNTLADRAIQGDYDYIFWMDTDQTFPEDCLPRLLSYCERDGREAASGLYTYKVSPYLPHIYPKFDETTGKFHVAKEFPVDKPIRIEGAGFGCFLMKTSVFKRVQKPYFTMKFEDGKMVEGEDLPFYKRAKMDMVLDPQVVCGHMHTGTFGLTDYLNYNNIDIQEGWVKPTPEQMALVIKKHKER